MDRWLETGTLGKRSSTSEASESEFVESMPGPSNSGKI